MQGKKISGYRQLVDKDGVTEIIVCVMHTQYYRPTMEDNLAKRSYRSEGIRLSISITATMPSSFLDATPKYTPKIKTTNKQEK